MFNLFDLNIIPTFLSRFKVNKILTIGLSNKEIINKVLNYSIENNALLTSIDPNVNISEFKNEENKEFLETISYHKDSSLNILPTLKSFDAIFINGDPNWYTVYNELNLIKKTNSSFPLVFICNNKYPHKRRDSYLNPEDIPEEFKNECCNDLPIVFEQGDEIKRAMIKDGFCHAIYKDTPKNGVLTAIEDFISENKSLKLLEINPIEGVTLIYKPSNIVDIRINKILEEMIESKYTPGDLSDKFIENNLLLAHVVGIDILKKDIDKLNIYKSEIEDKDSLIKNYQRDVQLHDTQMRYKESQINNIESQVNFKDTQLKSIEAKLINKENTLKDKENKIKEITSLIEEKENDFKSKEEHFNIVENKYKEILKINEKEINDKERQLVDVKNQLSIEKDFKNKEDEFNLVENKYKELIRINKKELYDMGVQLENTKSEFASKEENFKIQLQDKENKLKYQESELKRKETQLKISEVQLESKSNRLDLLKSKFDKQTSKLSNKEHCINCYEEEIQNSTTEVQYLKKSDKVSKKLLIPFAYAYLIGKSNPKEIGTNIKLYRALKSSECFDIGYYLNTYPDIPKSKWCKYFSPELHYVCNGFDEDRKFNKKYYNKKSRKELLKDVKNK